MRAMVFMLLVVGCWAALAGTEWLVTDGVEVLGNSLPPTPEVGSALVRGLMVVLNVGQ